MTAIEGRPLDDADLLEAWERTADLARPWRELAILELAGAGPTDEVARLPVGVRDGLVLDVRERIFGNRVDATLTCPACDEPLELAFEVDELRPAGPAPTERHEVTVDGWTVAFRLPDSIVLAACRDVDGDPGPVLLRSCIEQVRRGRTVVDPERLPAAVARAVVERMAELDPGAERLIDVACPSCGQSRLVPFDPGAYLLRELDDHARHLLLEVDQLARAYGWREAEVLALPARRRRQYLELASR